MSTKLEQFNIEIQKLEHETTKLNDPKATAHISGILPSLRAIAENVVDLLFLSSMVNLIRALRCSLEHPSQATVTRAGHMLAIVGAYGNNDKTYLSPSHERLAYTKATNIKENIVTPHETAVQSPQRSQ